MADANFDVSGTLSADASTSSMTDAASSAAPDVTAGLSSLTSGLQSGLQTLQSGAQTVQTGISTVQGGISAAQGVLADPGGAISEAVGLPSGGASFDINAGINLGLGGPHVALPNPRLPPPPPPRRAAPDPMNLEAINLAAEGIVAARQQQAAGGAAPTAGGLGFRGAMVSPTHRGLARFLPYVPAAIGVAAFPVAGVISLVAGGGTTGIWLALRRKK